MALPPAPLPEFLHSTPRPPATATAPLPTGPASLLSPAMAASSDHRSLLALACLCVVLWTPHVPAVSCLSVSQVQTLSGYVVAFINATATTNPTRYPMLPALVRLAFHDCAGTACDGCINLALASNKGLKPVVDGLEAMYLNATLGIKAMPISRADFWALAGLVAVNYGAKLQQPPPPPPPGAPPPPPAYIPASLTPVTAFKTGRLDCGTAPKGAETDSAFPDGLANGTTTLKWFANAFGFTADEAVAILGAHTLGRANPNNSGFQGPWVARDNTLDNAYYADMSNANAGWAQTKVATSGKIQWTRVAPPPPGSPAGTPGPSLLMLNADMCLLKNFNTNATGGASCTYAACSAAPTAPKVLAYARNNTKWLDDFGAVYAKMQAVCGRTVSGTTTTIKQCTLSSLTGTLAARSAAVQARIARRTAAPHVQQAVAAAAEAVAAATAENAAAPFAEPDTVRASADATDARRRAHARRLA